MLLLRPPLLRRAGLSRRLTTATATAPAALAAFNTLPAPATHPSFDIVRNVDLREDLGDVTATLYKHKTTGAEILSMKSSDNNKVFGVTFGTPPSSSNGVAHILEHSVLCGGQKYPLKEPFVELLKGSMNTFLNAFTYPDRTCYPVASTNLKDFYNLIDVYLDAVFVPNITELTFKQEGWHLAPDTDKDPDQLIYRGVVFNEMKGVYSQPDSLVHRHMSHAMYPNPTHVYGVDSGGDPVHIPELSYEEFVDFHKQYYRPSNARIFFFGDDCEEERLRLVEATFDNLLQVDPNRCGPMPKPKPPIRPLSDGPGLKLKIPYVVDEVGEVGEMGEVDAEAAGGDAAAAATGQYYAMSGWVLNEAPLGLEESITMSIANDLLVGNTSSTLYRDLMDSQLGTAFIGGGLSDELQQATFSAGLKGVHEEDCSKIDQVVQQSLQNVVAKGFAQEAIDASVNSTEFSLLEFNTGGMPRGLSLMLAANPCWLYQDDPFLHLEMKKAMRNIRAKVDDHQPIFSDIVNRYLVQNSCRASVELIPDPALGAEQERLERDTLDQIRASITLEEFEQIKVAQTELLAHQSSTDPPEVLNLIPRLQLSDLEPAISTTPRAHGGEAGGEGGEGGEGAGNTTTVLVHEMAETNGIVYVEVVLDASDVDMAQLKVRTYYNAVQVGVAQVGRTNLS
jgi:Zn-dependent M16 (insulinase) family peptidase